ncbi:MAG: winged helix-turn-helix domain-containing protein [Gemmatimonadota bacterium]
MARPEGSAKQLERRRHRAMRLLDQGRSLGEVAELVGCHASSVMRWRDAREREGAQGLKVRKASGRPPKLSEAQAGRLRERLLEGAVAQGYRTELWTTQRIAEVIEAQFGVRYHRDHVGRLMRRLGWSCQKPERRALERWKRESWPEVKKTPGGWVPTSSSRTKAASS